MNHSRDEDMTLLRKWEGRYAECQKVSDEMQALFGFSGDSRVFDAIWGLFDDYTDSLACRMGASDWLAWYQGENDMGARKHQAGYDKKLKRIQNLDDLMDLIEQSWGRG